MLYARVHSKELQSIEKSESLLNQAYNEITSSDEYLNNVPNAIFSALFNCNGYALILFRNNKIEEVKNLMIDCIAQIDNISIIDGEEKLELYRSVLVYNLAQCYERLGDYNNAIISLNRLLDKDKLMDTYYLDLARVYGYLNDIDSAIFSCRQTTLINPYSHQNWATLAYWQLQKTLYLDSAFNYYYAYKLCLDPKKSLMYLNDALYSKILSKEQDCCPDLEAVLKNFVTNKELFGFDESEVVKSFSLLAETELCKGNQKQALDYLSLALVKFPNNNILKQNYEFLSSLYFE
ncbi:MULTISPECIES: tetratricopeptide repeat protein [unclassified Moraxella]|uniref:tetratricopeptide repeat protein n=1 Tax=unclassified Moraxella TaxID=2685852 RepID=UPI00359CFB1D